MFNNHVHTTKRVKSTVIANLALALGAWVTLMANILFLDSLNHLFLASFTIMLVALGSDVWEIPNLDKFKR